MSDPQEPGGIEWGSASNPGKVARWLLSAACRAHDAGDADTADRLLRVSDVQAKLAVAKAIEERGGGY